MSRHSVPGVLITAAIAAAALAGCATTAPGNPGPAPSASASTTGPLVPPQPQPHGTSAQVVRLHVHRGPAPSGSRIGPLWRVVEPAGAARAVTIAWSDSPSAACGAATDVWVAESGGRVVIDLTGRPARPTLICAALVVPRRMSVPLAAPLGSRHLFEHRPSVPAPRSTCPPGPVRAAVTVPAIACPLHSAGTT
jgi:hypothetical protein